MTPDEVAEQLLKKHYRESAFSAPPATVVQSLGGAVDELIAAAKKLYQTGWVSAERALEMVLELKKACGPREVK
jgi:hypothetical protein